MLLREHKCTGAAEIDTNRTSRSPDRNTSIEAELGSGRRIAGAIDTARGVAQLGSASALGAEGRRFKSCHPDQATGRTAACNNDTPRSTP